MEWKQPATTKKWVVPGFTDGEGDHAHGAAALRLKHEGEQLAEAGQHGAALARLDAAAAEAEEGGDRGLLARVHEMRAQLLLLLERWWDSVQAAERAAAADPTWAQAWQTLGRAQLDFGELHLAQRSLQRAAQLEPSLEGLQEDAAYVAAQLQRREAMPAAQLGTDREGNTVLRDGEVLLGGHCQCQCHCQCNKPTNK
eukprot:TRINITY_DN4118_c0_g1_i1.p1 TRINITY_DN4118_c0_g1~~TRINITY_DN4118_c0_g1_i1.p1  ORF type:complete len:230 (-),score=69.36 TRINITY_DN4118_c0_g1_i1:15-608(-)